MPAVGPDEAGAFGLGGRDMGTVEPGSSSSRFIEDRLTCVALENTSLRITVLPSLGGKIASIQLLPGGEELLQQPLLPYASRTHFMSFAASDASGWDECLPSVAPCEVQTALGKTTRIPDHGDFWQVEWQVESQDEDGVTLSADGFSLPLRFSKTLQLEESRLQVSYRLRNMGKVAVDYVYSAHPLFVVDPSDGILLPQSVKEVTVEGSAKGRLGVRGTKLSWPVTRVDGSRGVDLSFAGSPADSTGDKLFAASTPEGWCAVERKQLRRRITLRFDPIQLPYLGLWLCYGGWPEEQENRQQCVALEPCTAEGDSLAIASKDGRARRLEPEEENRWTITLEVTGVS